MSNLRRKMLSISSQNDNNNDNNNDDGGQKFYLFKDGSLQNNAKLSSSKSNSIEQGMIKVIGSRYKNQTETSSGIYRADEWSQGQAENHFINSLDPNIYDITTVRPQPITKDDILFGWRFFARIKNAVEGYTYYGSITLSLVDIENFDFSKYKNIGFTIKDHKTNIESSSVELSHIKTRDNSTFGPSSGGGSQIATFSQDGTYIKALGGDLAKYNIIVFKCKGENLCYKITEIYLQE